MVYGKPRSNGKVGAQITAPKKLPQEWTTIIIRRTHYFMLRELAEKLEKPIGVTAMLIISEAFNAELKKLDPSAEYRPFVELPKVDKRKQGHRKSRPLKITGRTTGRNLALTTPVELPDQVEELNNEK
jgi:hypothetical protein